MILILFSGAWGKMIHEKKTWSKKYLDTAPTNIQRSNKQYCSCALYTDKKDNQIFLIYKEIQSGVDAKSYMRKSFLIYEEMRKYFPIYCMRRPLVSHIWLCNCSALNFLILYMRKTWFSFFYQCTFSYPYELAARLTMKRRARSTLRQRMAWGRPPRCWWRPRPQSRLRWVRTSSSTLRHS